MQISKLAVLFFCTHFLTAQEDSGAGQQIARNACERFLGLMDGLDVNCAYRLDMVEVDSSADGQLPKAVTEVIAQASQAALDGNYAGIARAFTGIEDSVMRTLPGARCMDCRIVSFDAASYLERLEAGFVGDLKTLSTPTMYLKYKVDDKHKELLIDPPMHIKCYRPGTLIQPVPSPSIYRGYLKTWTWKQGAGKQCFIVSKDGSPVYYLIGLDEGRSIVVAMVDTTVKGKVSMVEIDLAPIASGTSRQWIHRVVQCTAIDGKGQLRVFNVSAVDFDISSIEHIVCIDATARVIDQRTSGGKNWNAASMADAPQEIRDLILVNSGVKRK